MRRSRLQGICDFRSFSPVSCACSFSAVEVRPELGSGGPGAGPESRRGCLTHSGVPDGGKEDARPRGGPGSWLPSPGKEVPSVAGGSAQRWGRRQGGSGPPCGGPPFWGILARFSGVSFAWPFILAHLSQPPRAWALVPLPVPPHCPSPEERTMVVRRGWWRGLAGRTRLAGAIVCGALNVCTASALAAEWGTSIPGMLPEPTEGPVLEHLASPAHPCQASESSCHSHLWGRRWRGMR